MRKESDSGVFNCIICKEDRQYYCFGKCEHRGVCNFCCMRLRILYNDKKCPLCSEKLDYVFIFEIEDRPSFKETDADKETMYTDSKFEENGIYYGAISAKEEALKLQNFICPIKGCKNGVFENLQVLTNHLSQIHKRFYCETCIRQGKRFLAEMPIYNESSLMEHMTYGEYSDKGTVLVPPHPMCPFCNIYYYNDEFLYKHMNEEHFMCQLCKDRKNIIFYKEYTHLSEHHRVRHYVCPYQECLEDIFVVFDSEEKLNSHLITKHKCMDAQRRINDFVFKEKKDKKEFYGQKDRNSFNFSDYIQQIKENMNAYIKNVMEHKHVYSQNTQGYNQNQNQNNHYQNHNQNNHYQNQNQNNHYQNQNNYYQNQNTYENNNYNSRGRGGKNRGGENGRQSNRFDMVQDNNQFNNKTTKTNNTEVPSDYYSFVFNSYTNLTKEYVSNKIKKVNPKEEEFIIARETIYQMIMIIDKLSNQQMAELQSLTNFGIDLDSYRELKTILIEGLKENKQLFNVLDKLDIRQILLLYKYFLICSKKIDAKFYKLELEQIEPNLYDDFVVRDKSKRIQIRFDAPKQEVKKETKKKSDHPFNQFGAKVKINNTNFPSLWEETKTNTEKKGDSSKLKNLFTKKEQTNTPTPTTTTTTNYNNMSNNTQQYENWDRKGENKLTLLLDNKLPNQEIKPKKKPKEKWGTKNFNKQNYDEDFPEL